MIEKNRLAFIWRVWFRANLAWNIAHLQATRVV